jgi:sugar/nucleoside kinase (ribokinase family)
MLMVASHPHTAQKECSTTAILFPSKSRERLSSVTIPQVSQVVSVNFAAIAGLIIDDIVLPTGETRMGVPGGSGTHSAWGMRIWSERVGLLASYGTDCPTDILAAFDQAGIALNRAQANPEPTPRCWQIFEFNQHRTEIFRTSEVDFYRLQPILSDIPAEWQKAAGFHLLHEAKDMPAFASHLRAGGVGCLLAEPPPTDFTPEKLDEFAAFLPLVDVFSPNWEESAQLLGTDDPEAIVGQFLEMGVPLVALRMGESGSLIATIGERWRIPAVSVSVVDVTGAGNSYCGGFLVGLAQTGDPHRAGLYGAVSASFTIEQFGLPRIDGETERLAAKRLAEIS